MSTNNDILFMCQLDILNSWKTLDTQIHATEFVSDYHIYGGSEDMTGQNFSFDNWIGVICWLEYFGFNYSKDVPLFGRHTLRPDNFAFFLFVKHPAIGVWLLWIKQIAMIISVLRDKRIDHYGGEYRDTDGLILGKLILMTNKMPITSWIWHMIVDKKWGCWQNAFRHYHSNNPNDIQKRILEVL